MRDLEAHRIPARLQIVANFISKSHFHTWNADASSRGAYSFFGCIDQEKDWNHNLAVKAGIVAAGAFCGVVLLGIPLVVTAKIVADMTMHASQVEKDLAWVADEIETIYHRTNALIVANLI